jgi:hypothetical protein
MDLCGGGAKVGLSGQIPADGSTARNDFLDHGQVAIDGICVFRQKMPESF